MKENLKFQRLKTKMLRENEEKYGKEARDAFGCESIDAANAKFAAMSPEKYARAETISIAINETIREAMETGDPAETLALKAGRLHKEWLCIFWKDGAYSPEAHIGLGEMYVSDGRFLAYYDKIAPGAAVFMRDAIRIFCKEETK